MNSLKEFEVAPAEQTEGKQWVTTRSEIDHRIGGEVREIRRARFQERKERPLRAASWTLDNHVDR